MLKKILLIASLFFLQNSIAAETLVGSGDFSCSKVQSEVRANKVVVYFLNGISNSPTQAQLSAIALFNRLKENTSFSGLVADQKISLRTLYNPTDPRLGDFAELAIQAGIQSRAMSATEKKLAKWGKTSSVNTNEFQKIKSAFYSEELNAEYQAYWGATYSREHSSTSLPNDPDGRRLISHYQSLSNQVLDSMLQGNKVIIVAHSQGNYVAQGIHSYINGLQSIDSEAKNALRVIGVANVAATTPNNRYTTVNQDDAVFFWHDAQGGTPMAANFDATFSNNEELDAVLESDVQKQNDEPNHSFIQTYLNAKFSNDTSISATYSTHATQIVSRGTSNSLHSKIIDDVINSINEASFPPTIVGDGVITNNLTWLGNDDIDLHVYEPLSHVYYSSKNGEIGYLDRDDTDGQGPEHYYASCASLTAYQTTNSPQSIILRIGVRQYSTSTSSPELVNLGLNVGYYRFVVSGLTFQNREYKDIYKLEVIKKSENSSNMIFSFRAFSLL